MSRSPIATITIVSLLLLAVCCQVLPSMHMHAAIESGPETMAHLMLLTISAPGSVWTLLFVVTLLFFVGGGATSQKNRRTPDTSRFYAHSPDNIFLPPLVKAFADGILNPKPY